MDLAAATLSAQPCFSLAAADLQGHGVARFVTTRIKEATTTTIVSWQLSTLSKEKKACFPAAYFW